MNVGEKMDIAKLQDAGIDYEDGLRRCAGNDTLYERLLGMFAQDTNYAESLEAFEKQDWDGLFSHMHEIKGMSSNLSMTEVYADAAEIVALLRAQDYDAIAPVIDRLRKSYALVIEAIGAWFVMKSSPVRFVLGRSGRVR